MNNFQALIKNYDNNAYARLFDLAGNMEKQLAAAKSFYQSGNYESALQQVDNFGIIFESANSALGILNGNDVLAEELSIKKESFKRSVLDEFRIFCENKNGRIADTFAILPFCRLESGEILGME